MSGRLRGISEHPPAQMARGRLEAAAGLRLRHPSHKLTRSIHSKAVSDLWRRRADLSETLQYQWPRDPGHPSPTRQLPWTRGSRLPGKWEATLLDPVFRFGLCQRLGYPAPGTGQRCGCSEKTLHAGTLQVHKTKGPSLQTGALRTPYRLFKFRVEILRNSISLYLYLL